MRGRQRWEAVRALHQLKHLCQQAPNTGASSSSASQWETGDQEIFPVTTLPEMQHPLYFPKVPINTHSFSTIFYTLDRNYAGQMMEMWWRWFYLQYPALRRDISLLAILTVHERQCSEFIFSYFLIFWCLTSSKYKCIKIFIKNVQSSNILFKIKAVAKENISADLVQAVKRWEWSATLQIWIIGKQNLRTMPEKWK